MILRTVTVADFPGVQALHRRVGWPERSLAGWRWLFDSPARQAIHAPAGWVVEGEDGTLLAHLGNMVQRFSLDDRDLYGATGFSIIVLPAAKGASRSLIRTFLNQQGMFAAYTLNANALSQPLYSLFGMQAWPAQTHALKLSWPVSVVPLAMSRLLKIALKIAPGPVARLGEQLMNDRLTRLPELSLSQGVERLTDLADTSRYAAFWERLKTEGGLIADRGPAALRWRLSDPDQTTTPLLLSFSRAGRITGYAMAVLAKNNILETPVLEILDLQALAGEAEAIPVLMDNLIAAARPLGAAKVRLQVVSPGMLDRLGRFADRARREGGWGHCHVGFAPDAPDAALWSPTPYDGDHGVCLRPVPINKDVRARSSRRSRPTAAKA
ncbi:MAG: N-acetyltransferase [Brevundimonas sp.]|nr:MAG: N-acetyltransferase [Brevundimonas sp.]